MNIIISISFLLVGLILGLFCGIRIVGRRIHSDAPVSGFIEIVLPALNNTMAWSQYMSIVRALKDLSNSMFSIKMEPTDNEMLLITKSELNALIQVYQKEANNHDNDLLIDTIDVTPKRL